jgi:excisionase family DNA binding protein
MKGWLKPKAAAEYCDIGERTLRTWLKEDGLRSSKIRGTVLIKKSWIDKFLEAHEATNNGKEVDHIVCETLKEMNL